MSGLSEERERDDIQQGVSKPLEPELNLFKPKGVTICENWQCIYRIAPTNEKKDWLLDLPRLPNGIHMIENS